MPQTTLTNIDTASADTRPSTLHRKRWIERTSRASILLRLKEITWGRLILNDRDGLFVFGDNDNGPVVQLVIHDPRFYSDLALGGTIAAGETFVKGYWSCDDLVGLVRIVLRNGAILAGASGWLRGLLHKWIHRLRRNSVANSQQNIAAHYDLGNEFFELLLDETMMYSCGFFEEPTSQLAAASVAKVERISRKLNLRPEHHVLEIGSGWGFLACYVARHFGCRVTTTTISRQQFDETQKRIVNEGLEDRVTVIFEDYRNLKGQFDRLISVEMIEAVGHEYLDTFFEQCSSLLRPNGMMAIQEITIPDYHLKAYTQQVDFIQRYIFPGGALPSLGQIMSSTARRTDLRLIHAEDLSEHYALTLKHWRANLLNRAETVRSMGFNDAFLRQWEYYFSYCEGGFKERTIGLSQLVFAKPMARMENTRDRLVSNEKIPG